MQDDSGLVVISGQIVGEGAKYILSGLGHCSGGGRGGELFLIE